jgi:ribosomal 50S subunit-recycling heat shock protein
MRLDKYLVVSRLVKQRAAAKGLCDAGRVRLDGKRAKPSHEVKAGDALEIETPGRRLSVKVINVPAGKSVPRAEAAALYEILAEGRPTENG